MESGTCTKRDKERGNSNRGYNYENNKKREREGWLLANWSLRNVKSTDFYYSKLTTITSYMNGLSDFKSLVNDQ